ncbi:MAG TPA: GNAT family N-acetyltransferase [Chloroflexota bacterium]|nr:GNAT family N-acetyltransferase [Chloroflexota bacterium]HUM70098.1 GNAT family N-acetyltransferase [Chloroflexota bacterium]
MSHSILAISYTWWRGDELPLLPRLPDFRCERIADVPLLSKLHNLEPAKIEARLNDANTAYVAYIEDQPVGYGWSGANSVGVGSMFWPITSPDRGLWDFFTLEDARGRGVYPQLLQAILRSEQYEAEKFWIGHRVDNYASKRGIEKAGFQQVNFVVATPERQIKLVPRGNLARSHGDPQGRHCGFTQVTDEEMKLFDFGDLMDGDEPSL